MLTLVDRANGFVIHKVTAKKGKVVAYQTMPEGVYDAEQGKRYAFLDEARHAIGADVGKRKAEVELTKPKAEHPQNQKGYRADSQRKAKK